MKGILIVSYYFPPFGGGAVARVHSFAKYLPEFGYQPLVVTADTKYYESHFLDASLLREYSDQVEIVRTRSLEPGARGVKDLVFGRAERSPLQEIKFRLLRWIQRHILIPDRCVLWRPQAIRAGLRIAAKKRVVSVWKPEPKALWGKNSLVSGRQPAENRGWERRRVDPQGAIWEISV